MTVFLDFERVRRAEHNLHPRKSGGEVPLIWLHVAIFYAK